MNILVTGSAVVCYLIRDTQDSAVNLDKLTYAGNLGSLAEVAASDRYAFEQVDICNRAELEQGFAEHQPDAVMHLADESHVDQSLGLPILSKPISSASICCWKLRAPIGMVWMKAATRPSVSNISQPTRCMGICPIRMNLKPLSSRWRGGGAVSPSPLAEEGSGMRGKATSIKSPMWLTGLAMTVATFSMPAK